MLKKIICFVILIALLAALTACGLLDDTSKKDPIAGVWKYNYPFILINSDKAIADSSEEYLKIYDGLYFIRILELREDGTYSLYDSKESIQAAEDQFIENYKVYLPYRLCEKAGINMEEFTELCKQKGYTVEEFAAYSMNTSGLEAALRSQIQQFFQENDILDTGSFRYTENKLFLTPEGERYNPDDYFIFSIQGNELCFSDASQSNKERFEIAGTPLPITFYR